MQKIHTGTQPSMKALTDKISATNFPMRSPTSGTSLMHTKSRASLVSSRQRASRAM